MSKKILIIVEGDKEEINILCNPRYGLLQFMDSNCEIVAFKNPIYELYEKYKDGTYDDIVTYLRHNKNLNIDDNNKLSKQAFSAIYLIFDYEAHYQKYSNETIIDILNTFNDETNNGKIYINYPMVESYYHLTSLPDYDYVNRTIKLDYSSGKEYKKLVNKEMPFKKNRITKEIVSLIILQNYEKALKITESTNSNIDYLNILNLQINMKNDKNEIYVLSTFPLMLTDYNELLIESIKESVKNSYGYEIYLK